MEYVQYIISLALSIYVLSSSEADDYLNSIKIDIPISAGI